MLQQRNFSLLFPSVLIPLLGLSPNLNGTGKTDGGCPRGGGKGAGATADVTSRKNEGCVSALINSNESATMGEIFGWCTPTELRRRVDPKAWQHTRCYFLLYLPLALCIVFSSKTDFLLLSTRLLKSHGFLLFYYVTSLSWSKRWIPMIFVLLPAAICCSITESQNPNTTQMLVWILETLVGFGVIVFAEKPEYSESSDGKVTETISKGRHNDAKRVDN